MEEIIRNMRFRRVEYEFRDVNHERCGGYEYKVSHKMSREKIIERIIRMLKEMEREGLQLYFRDEGRYEVWPTIYGDKKGVDVPYFVLRFK